MLVGAIVEGRLNDDPRAPRHPTAVSYEFSHLSYFAALLGDTNGDDGVDDDDSLEDDVSDTPALRMSLDPVSLSVPLRRCFACFARSRSWTR